ncbi:MAG: MoxR family ATPase [Epulopiscium sp.]|nr:MoxR family ATPase [Candidatus Epulonipiscium sp.]
MYTIINDVIESVEKVIIGKREVIEKLLVALLSNGHVLIEDIPGVGKTQLAAALARSLNGDFNRIQFTPDVMPSDITGFFMYNQDTKKFYYHKGAAICNFLLVDEINRTSPKTQSSLLEIMEEFQVTVDGKTFPLPKPFMVLATQNPIESSGTYPLPEAQMDRFFLKISLGYPSKGEEKKILDRFEINNPLQDLNGVVTTENILNLQEEVKGVKVHDGLKNYIVSIAEATRNSPHVVLGISPRGSINLLKASKAWAFIKGRRYVIPDDIKEIAPHVLSHRIITKPGKNINGEEIIRQIINSITVPVFQRDII